VATGEPLKSIASAEKNGRFGYPSFSADGKILALGDEASGPKRHASVWETDTGKRIGAFPVLQFSRVQTALSPDGKTLATWGQHGTMPGIAADPEPGRTFQLWDVASG